METAMFFLEHSAHICLYIYTKMAEKVDCTLQHLQQVNILMKGMS